MFKVLIFLFVVHITSSFGSDFKKEFTRLLIEDSEQQLYGTYGRSNDGITLTFTQKLDHFRPADKATWEQRVMILNTHYDKRQHGPFFIYLFGNEKASMDWLRDSRIMSYAKDFKALVIGLEHRFYGDSRPFTNTSMENLNYLSTEQALADVAYFIKTVNKISVVPENTKWVAFGGFYGGSLAAWARMKYPHLLFGAVASSALISIKSDFPEYLESVKNSYISYDSICAKNIKLAIEQLNEMLSTEDGRAKITRQYSLCHSLENNEDDITIFKSLIQEMIQTAVERDYDDHFSMQTVCEIMNKNTPMASDNLKTVADRFASLKNARCWYVDRKTIIPLYQIETYEKRDQCDRLWTYQLCNEFGINVTSDKSVELFGENKPGCVPQGKFCSDVFGPEFNSESIDDAVEQTNMEFGALNFNTSKVIFTHGTMDPWQSAGILEKAENALYDLIRINGTSHRADLEPSHRDNNNLNNGIRQIKNLLKSWLE